MNKSLTDVMKISEETRAHLLYEFDPIATISD